MTLVYLDLSNKPDPNLDPDEASTSAQPPDLPLEKKIQIKVEGIRCWQCERFSHKHKGSETISLYINSPTNGWINSFQLDKVATNRAIGLYNPKTGIYCDLTPRPSPYKMLIDVSHYKDISEEDVVWRAVYPNRFDGFEIFYPFYSFCFCELSDPMVPLLFIKHIKKGIYLPTWGSRIKYKWKCFVNLITLRFLFGNGTTEDGIERTVRGSNSLLQKQKPE
ncbi:hypothetical protein TWF718_003376 [Orbilia javanica]|uniref:Uncharacterized protein n=1 Tax=Orbilia javanica TaxID=47235 RepID=A0AAN8NKM8_9PEZI